MKFTKLTVIPLLLTVLPLISHANDSNQNQNQIQMQMRAKAWVSTDSAKVTTRIDATLKDQKIDELQSEIQNKLNTIYGKDRWHMVQFQREETDSGLEKVVALAQGRIKNLATIRQKTQSLSRAGLKIQIQQISYTPTLQQREQSLATLRKTIYQRVQKEIDALEMIYTDQTFVVDNINFNPQYVSPRANVKALKLSAQSQPPQNLKVDTLQKLTAQVSIKRLPTKGS